MGKLKNAKSCSLVCTCIPACSSNSWRIGYRQLVQLTRYAARLSYPGRFPSYRNRQEAKMLRQERFNGSEFREVAEKRSYARRQENCNLSGRYSNGTSNLGSNANLGNLELTDGKVAGKGYGKELRAGNHLGCTYIGYVVIIEDDGCGPAPDDIDW